VTPAHVATGTASGKVILFGEHAVVYGAPAIAAGIERGARATAIPLLKGPSTLKIGEREITADASSKEDLGRAFAALLEAHATRLHVAVSAESELPAGGGLGSSAAIGVAIGRAVEVLDPPSDTSPEAAAAREARALERAAAWERVLHGNPSGIDATAAAKGGLFSYTRADGASELSLGADLVLCVGSTGQPSSTREMVELVAARRAKHPDLVARSIEAIAAIVKNAALAIEAGDQRAIGELMNMNQLVLSGLFVSTSEIEDLCALARGAGALGAKLTGGGGGGCVIALCPPSIDADSHHHDQEQEELAAKKILDAWSAAGARYEGFVTRIAARGGSS
jgi:mevalonate kinase